MTSAGSATLLFWFVFSLVQPSGVPAFHGILFSDLSRSPLSFHEANPVQYRFLGPLLGYLTGLRGELFYLLPWIFVYLLLFLVHFSSNADEIRPELPFVKAALLATSGLVFIPLAGPGYTDSITWFLLAVCLLQGVREPWLQLCMFGSVLNHEAAILAWPGILLWKYRDLAVSAILKKSSLGILAVLTVYLSVRYFISGHAVVRYDAGFYFFNQDFVSNLVAIRKIVLPGFFFVFRAAWVIPFWAIGLAFRERDRKSLVALLLMLMLPFVQLFIAYDVTRLLCLSFPVLLASFEYISKKQATSLYRVSIVILLVNLVMPFFIVGKDVFWRVGW